MQERERQFLHDLIMDPPIVGAASSQKAEILATVKEDEDTLVLIDKDIRLSVS